MRARRALACLVFAGVVWRAPVASAGVRKALVIGSNRGLADEPVLEFAENDAARVASAFDAAGSVASARITLIRGRPLVEIKRALQREALASGDEDELWLFVSGHADGRGIHVEGEIWAWSELYAQIAGARARRVIAFVDACASGALLTAKGLTTEAPLSIALQTTLRGRLIVSSSGANELSYESQRLGGSPYAHFLISGLRGPADANNDGRITVSELYAYLYARTVAASLGASGGPQHPEQAASLEGAGDWVLADRPQGGGELRLQSAALGTCYVLDGDEVAVLAELRATDPAPVSFRPGRYRVKCLSSSAARVATLNLGSGAVAVESLSFEAVPAEVMLARGPAARATNRLAARGGVWFDDSRIFGAATLGYSHDLGEFSFDSEVSALTSRQLVAMVGLLGRMPWWTLADTELDVGLSLGARFSSHDSDYRLLVGPVVQMVLPLSASLRLLLRQEILREIPLGAHEAPGLPLVTTAGFDWAPSP